MARDAAQADAPDERRKRKLAAELENAPDAERLGPTSVVQPAGDPVTPSQRLNGATVLGIQRTMGNRAFQRIMATRGGAAGPSLRLASHGPAVQRRPDPAQPGQTGDEREPPILTPAAPAQAGTPPAAGPPPPNGTPPPPGGIPPPPPTPPNRGPDAPNRSPDVGAAAGGVPPAGPGEPAGAPAGSGGQLAAPNAPTPSPASAPGGGTAGSGAGSPGTAASSPGAGPAIPQARVLTLANPSSGIDWTALLNQVVSANGVRVAGEISRPIPLVGVVGGVMADVVAAGQDVLEVSKEGFTFTGLLMGMRHGVNIANNLVGQLAYMSQWAQNVSTTGGVTIVFDSITSPAMVGIKQVKLMIDGVQIGLDVFIAAGAAYNAAHATTPESLARWNGFLTTYEANTIGDGLTSIFDLIDMVTAGFGQGESVNVVTRAGKTLLNFASGPIGGTIKGVLVGVLGVFGGEAPGLPTEKGNLPASAPGGGAVARKAAAADGDAGDAAPAANAAARRAAAAIVRDELKQIHALYTGVDTALDLAASMQTDMMADVRRRMTELLDGKDPFRFLVTSISQGLDRMNNDVTEMMRMGVLATDAKQRADAIVTSTDAATAAVDAIKVPSIVMPREGSGGVLDAAAGLVQEQIINRFTRQAESLVEGAKNSAKAPIAAVHDNATEIAEFSVIVQQTAERAVGQIQTRIAKFSKAIARCNSVEDVINTMINQAFQALGFGEGFTIEEARTAWREIGPLLDKAEEQVAAVAESSGRAPAAIPDAAGPSAAPAAPEPPPAQ